MRYNGQVLRKAHIRGRSSTHEPLTAFARALGIHGLEIFNKHVRLGVAGRYNNDAPPLSLLRRKANHIDLGHWGKVGLQELFDVALKLVCIGLRRLHSSDCVPRHAVDQKPVVVILRCIRVCYCADILEQIRLSVVCTGIELFL